MKRDPTSDDSAEKSHTGVGLVIGTTLGVGMGIALGTALSSVGMVTVGAVAGLSIGVAIGDALDRRAKATDKGRDQSDLEGMPRGDAS